MGKWTRRAFIGAGALVGGGLVLGVAGAALAPARHGLRSDDAESAGELTTWILVTPDNFVTVLVPHCEMGQGAQTALAMMAAEEMDADWNLVRIKEAPALDAYANAYIVRAFVNDVPGPFERGFDFGTYRLARWFGLQVTGGSMSVRGTGHHGMRVAGGAAREMLIGAAAAQFGVGASECTVANSRVTHTASGRSATFGELAKAATQQPVPTHPALKDPKSYTLRRRPQRRFDMRSKVDGSAIYGIDFTMPGLLHAAVEIAPVFGGKLVSVDTAAAEAMPGVKRIVRLDEAVAVVADTYWRARVALATLKPQFDDAGHGGVSTATIFEAFDKALGAPPDMPADAATVIKADYKIPFLPHAHDGADGVHRAGDRRSRRGVGRHAGSAERAQDRGRCVGLQSRAGAVHESRARRRLRPQAAGLPRLRRDERAHREGNVARAGEDDLEPRDRHAARLLSPGRHGAIRRRARRRRHAARRAIVLRRRR